MRYGYMDGAAQDQRSAPLLSSDGLKVPHQTLHIWVNVYLFTHQDYVAKFQEFAGLDATGELDPETLKLMRQPRYIHDMDT